MRKLYYREHVEPEPCGPVWEDWRQRLPQFPHCADRFDLGVYRRSRDHALGFRHVEINPPGRVSWLAFDIDRPNAYEAAEDADLAQPNALIVNPANGHAHMLYALRVPVGLAGRSRSAPRELLCDVERGMSARLRADPAYAMRFAKNPGHPYWRTSWLTPRPFELNELLQRLDRKDMRKGRDRSDLVGYGRHVDLFNRVRVIAYRNVLAFKNQGGSQEQWARRLIEVAAEANSDFSLPLPIPDVRSTARSIARWTWRRFSTAGFSQLQARRAVIGNERRGQETIARLTELFAQTKADNSSLYPDMADVLPVSMRVS